MNIEEARKHLKKNLNNWKKSKKDNGYMPEIMEEININYEAIETLLTAYEKEKRLAENHKTAFEKQTENLHEVEELLEKEKEKNKELENDLKDMTKKYMEAESIKFWYNYIRKDKIRKMLQELEDRRNKQPVIGYWSKKAMLEKLLKEE